MKLHKGKGKKYENYLWRHEYNSSKNSKGRTVMMQFDVHTGRPYDRINKLCGTKAVHNGYPSRLYIDKEELAYWGHQWLNQKEYQAYRDKYTHPMITQLSNKMELFKEGHGGMDFIGFTDSSAV